MEAVPALWQAEVASGSASMAFPIRQVNIGLRVGLPIRTIETKEEDTDGSKNRDL